MLWAALTLMAFAAVAFAVWPLVRDTSRNVTLTAVAVVFVAATSAGLYAAIGSPEVPSGSEQQPDVDEMVASLAERLEREPNDEKGWRMLGRSYMTLGNYAGAIRAFERLMELESGQNAQTLVDLGEALLASSGQTMSPRIASLFDSALAIDPNNAAALFWGGIAAVNRGEPLVAADRWERLMATNPPPEIRNVLAQRVAEWRGEPPPEAATEPEPAAAPSGAIVSASIALSDAAASALPADATVFVIARDPAQPSPPIAVTRRRLSELPAVVHLGDGESMIPGRELSGFEEFELIARVSVSGQPTPQAGDWFGAAIVRPSDTASISLSIDSPVQ